MILQKNTSNPIQILTIAGKITSIYKKIKSDTFYHVPVFTSQFHNFWILRKDAVKNIRFHS